MDEDFNKTMYVILANLCDEVIGPAKYNPKMTAAEILLVAIVAARYFNNKLERAFILLKQTGYIAKQRCLSVSGFNRQRHRYRDLLDVCLETLLELSRSGETFVPEFGIFTPSSALFQGVAGGTGELESW